MIEQPLTPEMIAKVKAVQERMLMDPPKRRINDILPRVIPAGWFRIPEADQGDTGCAFDHFSGRRILISIAKEQDGREWVHFSMSHRRRLPTWEELVSAKEMFLGRGSKAIQVIPPRSQYVNLNANVLHLFVCLDEDPLPDFTWGTGSL